jgi:hypothetical protein
MQKRLAARKRWTVTSPDVIYLLVTLLLLALLRWLLQIPSLPFPSGLN